MISVESVYKKSTKSEAGKEDNVLKSAASTVYEQDDDFKSGYSSQYNGFGPLSATTRKEKERDTPTPSAD